MIAPHRLGSPRRASAVSSPHQAGAPAALAGRRPKVIVVMPAYNAEATLERTLRDLPGDSANEVILVDDGSRDRTVAIAERLGLTVIRHRGIWAAARTRRLAIERRSSGERRSSP
jgi:cellulose synthase/poly-beta-1,6-N-acetylglucosamine synthase-like glycosyltransferase